METVKIYLSGAMSGISFEEQSKWRNNIMDEIRYNRECEKKCLFFNPVNYYNYNEQNHKSEKEVMEFDLYNLRNSNLVVVNLNNASSIGTAMELMLAKERNIPVIAFGVGEQFVHPWVLESCTRICDNLRDTVDHVVNFYLN